LRHIQLQYKFGVTRRDIGSETIYCIVSLGHNINFKHRNRHKEILGDQLTGLKMVYIKYFDSTSNYNLIW